MLVMQRLCPMCHRVLRRPKDQYAWWCECGWTTQDESRGVTKRLDGPDSRHADH